MQNRTKQSDFLTATWINWHKKPYFLKPCVTFTGLDPEACARFCQAIEPALAALDIDRARFAAGAGPLQYVVRAGRAPVRPLCLSGLILKPVAAVNDVRMGLPLGFQGTIPGTRVEMRVRTEEGVVFGACPGPDRTGS